MTERINPFRELIRFLKKPTTVYNPESISNQMKWKRALFLFFLNFLFGIAISLIANLLVANMPFQSDLEMDLSRYNTLTLFLFAGFFVPFLEEIIFRLPLVWSQLNLRISLIAALAVFGYGLISRHNIAQSAFIIILMVFIVSCLWIPRVMKWMEQFWKQYFIWIFYALTLLFALYHLSNYSPFSIKLLLIAPVLVSSQIVSSLFLGYIRINFGFIWSLGYHIVWNSLLILLTLVGKTAL